MLIRNEPLGAQLARRLRTEIFTWIRPAGELLIEKTLSEQYGLSRGPVRDAFTELKREGLIEAEGRSYRVGQVQASDIREFVDLRLALETLAVERAIAAEADLTAVRQAVDRMDAAADSLDHAAFAAADLDFHTGLIEATRQRRIAEAYRPLMRTLEVFFEINPMLVEDGAAATAAEHRALLDAVEAGEDQWRTILEHMLTSGRAALMDRFGRSWEDAGRPAPGPLTRG